MSRFITIVTVACSALLTACSDETPCPEIPQVALLPLSSDGSACKVDADCMPTEKLCGVSVCIDGTCGVEPIAKGEPCQSGVGTCDGAGECMKVDGACKGWDGPAINPCDDASECDDGSSCTADTCEAGWCHHAPLSDGKQCGSVLSCKQGLCCVPD
jgi:hypothetical protein